MTLLTTPLVAQSKTAILKVSSSSKNRNIDFSKLNSLFSTYQLKAQYGLIIGRTDSNTHSKDEIRNVIMRYARGVDRLDEDLFDRATTKIAPMIMGTGKVSVKTSQHLLCSL